MDGRRAAPEVFEGPQNVSFDEQRQLEEADIDRNQVTAQPLDVPAPIMAEDLSGVPIGALASLVASWRRAPA